MVGFLLFIGAVITTVVIVRGIEKLADWVAEGWSVEEDDAP